MRRVIGPCVILVATLVLAIESLAVVPKLVGFQGVLTDAGGNLIRNTNVSVTFRIYDATSGGTMLWDEAQVVGTDKNGSFNVLLGSMSPIPDTAFADSARWLGITVETDPEMTPRTRFTSVGYSYRVGSVDGAMGGSITSKISIGPGHMNNGNQAFVAGEDNTVSGDWSAIGGGIGNNAVGMYSTIPGGRQNSAEGTYSFAAGRRSKALHDGTFIWADDTDADLTSTGAGQFLIRATGGVGIGTSDPQRELDVNGQLRVSTGHFVSPSYFATLTDAGDALPAKVGALAITDTYSTDPPQKGLYVEGDIGVGTTNPTERVEVAGVVYSNSGGFKFPDGTTQITASSPVGTVLDYGSSSSSGTPVSTSQLKICYGKVHLTSSVLTISGLPFTSASSYTVVVTRDLTDYVSQAICTNKLSGSAFEIRDFTVNRYANWFAFGY